ncbi:hypothetical protein [Beijerinckia mobilis]|uniref:hypothetical protein n=1 Tax=Beijerinckia mobilis TaxID=231434 RepID=UPI000692579B|nr:hypothetical protein [Beijerinckia mobilis]
MSTPRILAAKRSNERVKLAAAALNALAIGVLGAAFVVPGVENLDKVHWWWIPVALFLHVMAHATFGFLRLEE